MIDWVPDTYASARVLNAIRLQESQVLSEVPAIFANRIEQLMVQYREVAQTLEPGFQPRNLPFFILIKDRYPMFHWIKTATTTNIECYFRGSKPSLLCFLLDIVPVQEVAGSVKTSRAAMEGNSIELMEKYLPTLRELGVCSLSNSDIRRINRWIEWGRAGRPLTIVSPVCPDYSFTAVADGKFRFTFESLGADCGLSGLRLLEAIEQLHQLFREELGCSNITHHICVGDFEGFSATNTNAVGLSKAEFVARNRISAAALAAASPVPVIASCFSDHCGGEVGWDRHYNRAVADFRSGAHRAEMADGFVQEIAESRRGLYERWHGQSGVDISVLEDIVIAQGAEYAAMGAIIQSTFENPLVIGADHHRMAPFYNFGNDLAVLYLERNYE